MENKREFEEFKKSEMIENFAKKFDVKKSKATEMIDFMFGQLEGALIDGKTFTQRSFGRFTPVFRERRKAMNVTRKTEVDIPSKYAPVLRFSKTLRDKVKDAANERSW